MEVKNPMVDQTLMNTVAQALAAQNFGKPKDAEQPDFDSMVHQKRSAVEKSETKAERTDAKPVRDEAPAEEAQKPVADEQYVIAAAVMFQAQPDMRYTAIQTEAVEAVPEITAELPEAPVENLPAEIVTELAPEAEQIEPLAVAEITAPVETEPKAELPQQSEAAPVESRSEAPVEARQPEVQPEERQTEQPATRTREIRQPEQSEQPVREERKVEAPKVVQAEESDKPEEDADTAQLAQGTPLFERVDAPVIKVAEATKPIPLEAEDGVEQLGDAIDTILVNDVSANRIEVTLTPENLGKLTVEITRGEDGTLNVVLHATTEKAANLLEKGADGLRQALTASAERAVQIQVRGSEESQQQFLNPDGQNEQNRGQQQQQRNGRRHEQQSAQDFLQQLRLGLVDVDNKEE